MYHDWRNIDFVEWKSYVENGHMRMNRIENNKYKIEATMIIYGQFSRHFPQSISLCKLQLEIWREAKQDKEW